MVIGDYQGWVDAATRPLCRRELPSCLVPLIFDFGAPFLLAGANGAAPQRCGSFVAGLWDGPALAQATGPTVAIQCNLTPLGAYRLLGTSMTALANRVVPLEDLLGRGVTELVGELAEATGWDARFDRLDQFLAQRLERGHEAAAAVRWGFDQLRATGGRQAIAPLARELGWSHRRLIDQWRNHFGLTPKTLGRILRFETVLTRLAHVERDGWANLAVDCGYADQSHLIRDCRALAGISPSELLRHQLADGGGLDAGLLLATP